jgi:formylglycine-generating enzyme required for sulfatase activity
MKKKALVFLPALLRGAAILPAALFLGACGGFQEDPRDNSYEFQTPAQYRELVTAVQAGTTATVLGEGAEGVFVGGRTVILGAYRIAVYETTWELWKEVYDWAQKNGYSIANKGREGHGEDGTGREDAPDRETRPVTGVTWRDALVWCNAYSELSGLEPVYYTADGETALRVSENNGATDSSIGTEADLAKAKREKNGFRLPLETEWEHAARGGATDKAGWNSPYAGGDVLADLGWHAGNAAQEGSAGYGAHPAGSSRANGLGLFDMSGNAAEWCWDWWNESPVTQATPPDGPVSGLQRVVRGGSWRDAAAACGVKARGHGLPFSAAEDLGFRVVRSIPDTGSGGSGDYPPTLAGTSWYWDSPWGMRIITFDTETHAIFDNYSNTGGEVYDDSYTYAPETGTGTIRGGYPAGDFQLKNDNKLMYFSNYKDYGHSAEFYFMEEE